MIRRLAINYHCLFILIQMSGSYTRFIENDYRRGNIRINDLNEIRFTVNCCLSREQWETTSSQPNKGNSRRKTLRF